MGATAEDILAVAAKHAAWEQQMGLEPGALFRMEFNPRYKKVFGRKAAKTLVPNEAGVPALGAYRVAFSFGRYATEVTEAFDPDLRGAFEQLVVGSIRVAYPDVDPEAAWAAAAGHLFDEDSRQVPWLVRSLYKGIDEHSTDVGKLFEYRAFVQQEVRAHLEYAGQLTLPWVMRRLPRAVSG